MTNTQIEESISEVLDILEHMDKIYVEKINKDFMDFLYAHKSTNYKSKLDYTKKFDEMDLKKDTENLLLIIYILYWSSEEERAECISLLKENEIQKQNELNENFDFDKLFSNKNTTVHKENLLPVEIKEKTIMEKIIDFIKKLFHF